MSDNKEREAQDIIEEDDKNFAPLLGDVNISILMEEDVDSESGSQNSLRGVHVEGPSHENEGTICMVTQEGPGTPGEAHSTRHSHH